MHVTYMYKSAAERKGKERKQYIGTLLIHEACNALNLEIVKILLNLRVNGADPQASISGLELLEWSSRKLKLWNDPWNYNTFDAFGTFDRPTKEQIAQNIEFYKKVIKLLTETCG